VLSLEGLQINVPADAVASAAAAEIRALPAAGLTRFLGGLTAVRAFDLNLPPLAQGAALEFVLRQRLVPSSFFVLARCVSSGVESGLQPVQRLASDAQGNVTSVEPASGARLSGLRGSGQYVLIQIAEAEGLITGTVRDVGGALLGGAMVRVVDESWLSITGSDGLFATLGKPGERLVLATDPADGNNGEATATLANAVAHAVVEIQTAPTGPRIISSTPTNGQQKVVASTPILVRFSEPLDRASFGPEALTVTNPLGVQVIGTLTLNRAATEASFLPTNPLEHAATYTVELAATIRDRQGLEIEGNRAFSFSVIPFFERPAGAQLVIYEPGADNVLEAVRSQLVGYSSAAGSSHVVAHGSAGTADPEVPVILVNQNTGATATVLSKPDGSFANFIDAAEEDFIEAVFVNANGTRVTVPATRQIYDNGKIGLYKYGGILEAESDGGPVQVLIEPEAIKERSVFTVNVVAVNQLAELTGGVMPEEGMTPLPGVRIDVENEVPEGEVEISIPINPSDLGLEVGDEPENAAVVLTVPVEIGGEVVYVVADKMRYENGRIFTNTCPFPGVSSTALQDTFITIGASMLSPLAQSATMFAQLAIPVLLAEKVNGIVVNGRAVLVGEELGDKLIKLRGVQDDLLIPSLIPGPGAAAAEANSLLAALLEEGIVATGFPVQGALIALRKQNENFDGKIRPGLVAAVTDQQGCFSLMVPLGATGKLLGTHPRYGRGEHVSIDVSALIGIGLQGALARNIIFTPKDEDLFSNRRPRLVVSHDPLDPPIGVPTRVQVDVFVAGGATNLEIELDEARSVARSAVQGNQGSFADLVIEKGEIQTVGGHKRRVFTIATELALHAVLAFKATATFDGRAVDSLTAHAMSFGFGRPPIVNPLLPSDPNDTTPPEVVTVFPGEGGYLYPGNAVQVRFSEPIDRALLQTPGVVVVSGQQSVPGLFLSPNQQELTIHPRLVNTGEEVKITLGMGIRDLAGNAMAASRTLTYRLGRFAVSRFPGVVNGGGSVLDGSMAYVLERANPSGVRVFDVSNPQSPVQVAHIQRLAERSAVDFPRDAVVIRGWNHFTGYDGTNFTGKTEDPLLCVVGGLTGSVSVDDLGNDFQNGQYLTIFSVSNPRMPQLLFNVQITARAASVPKLRWQAPFLTYLENSADTHFVNIVDLQVLLVGFATNPTDRLRFFGVGRNGLDLNADGDYTDLGDVPPKPKVRDAVQYMGFRAGYDVQPFPAQRIEDFDSLGMNSLAVVRTTNGVNTQPGINLARPEFRLLLANGVELPQSVGRVTFERGARPKRVALVEGVRVADGRLRNLAFVSLSPDADGEQKLVVIDWSDPVATAVIREVIIPSSLGLGVLQSPVLGPDGLLRVATTTGQVLLDPSLVFLEQGLDPLHPAVIALLPEGGSGNTSIGVNDSGLRTVALGSRTEVVQGPPTLEFVQFPTLGAVVDPRQARLSAEERTQVIDALRPATALRPVRFRTVASAPSTLSPPSPLSHYHVLLRAPGGSGVTVPLVLESTNESGAAMSSKGKGFPPVRAAASAGQFQPGGPLVDGVDAPVVALSAYRLSDDPADVGFNLYLSDPIAVVREKLVPSELQSLYEEQRRVILWSEVGLRAGIDVGAPGSLADFAADYDSIHNAYVPKVAVLASTLPGGFVPGSTSPPVGGELPIPGTFGVIDAAGGEFRHTTEDIELPSRRMPIILERTATSHALVHSGFGRGWDFNYNQRVIDLDPKNVPEGQNLPVLERGGAGKDIGARSRDIIFNDGAGNAIVFKHQGNQAPLGVANDPLVELLGWKTVGGDFYLPAPEQKGVFDLMFRFPSGEIVRLTPNGTQFRYRKEGGRLMKIEDRYPDNFHELKYNDAGQLVKIVDRSVTSERSLRLGYFRDPGDRNFNAEVDKSSPEKKVLGLICTLLDFAGRRVDFEYDAAGMLVRRKDIELAGANGGFKGRPQTTYQIHPQTRSYIGVIAGVGTHGDGDNSGSPIAVAQVATNGQGEAVATATTGAGGQVGISVPSSRSAANIASGVTQASHADGSSTSVSYDANGYPAGISSSGPGAATAGHQTFHNERGLPETIIFPEGNAVRYEYAPSNAPFRSLGNVVKIMRDPGVREGEVLTSETAYDFRYNLPSGQQKDFNGKPHTITLTSSGRDIAFVTYPIAGTQSFVYNDYGQLQSEANLEGVVFDYTFDSSTGYLDRRILGGTLTTEYKYNDSVAAKLGMATSIIPPRGEAISMEYDAMLRRVRTTRAGQQERTSYDENGNVVSVSRALGDGEDYEEMREYSQIDFLKSVTIKGVEGVGDLVTTFVPDSIFRVKEVKLPGNEVRRFEYNHLGHVTKLELGPYKEEYTRDLNGSITAVKRGDDEVQTIRYDGHDRPVEIREKTGEGDDVTTLTYFGKGELKTRTVTGSVGGMVTETVVADVDEIGRPLSTQAKGTQVDAVVTTSYTENGGRTVKSIGPVDTFTATQDAAGRPLTQADSLRSVTLTPDENGNVTRSVSLEDGRSYHVDMVYNDLDQLTKASDPVGTIFENSLIRSDGLPRVVTNGAGNSITKSYSRLGEVLAVDKPEQIRFAYGFDKNRQAISVKDRANGGNVGAYDAGADGTLRPTTMTWRDGSSTIFNSPDGRNLPTSITIPGGSMTAAYDLQGRVKSLETTYSGGNYKMTDAQYDALGRLRSAKYGSTGQYTMTAGYDKLGPLTSVTYDEVGGSYSISSTIRQDGARLTLVYPSGVSVTETRQASGRLTRVEVAGENIWEATAFAGANQPATVNRGANITESSLYDARRRLVARRFTGPGNAMLEDMRLKYDGADNVVVRQFLSGGGRADAFGYDTGNRLVRADYGVRPIFAGSNRDILALPSVENFAPGLFARTYGYDFGGLDLLQSSTLINPEALVPQSAAASALAIPQFASTLGGHDSFLFPQNVDGFVRSAPDPLGNTARAQFLVRPLTGTPQLVTANLAYNAHSNLIQLQMDNGVRVDYQYRPDKLMHHRKVTGSPTAGERSLVWHDGQLLEEYDLVPTKVLVARYYYANDDPPVAADLRQPDGSMMRVHFFWDQLLSVVAVANEAGQVIERVRYDAWGQPVITAADTAPPRISELRRDGDDILVVMSEPVLPPMNDVAGSTVVTTNGNTPSQAFRLLTGNTAQTPTVVFEENAGGLPFGTVFRLTPTSTLTGLTTLRVLAGGLVDAWNNPTQAEDFSFTLSVGPLLASGVGSGSTAPVAVSRSPIGNSWLWQGQWFDYDAGLVYIRNRHYDPTIGHFIQRDPEQYGDSVNLYAGMANNPVSYSDPTGLRPKKPSSSGKSPGGKALKQRDQLRGFGERQGMSSIEFEAITNVLARRLDRGEEIRFSIRSFGKKAAKRKEVAEAGVQSKPGFNKYKTNSDGVITYIDELGQVRTIASDLDALHLEIGGKMASHSQSMKFFGEVNREIIELGRKYGKPVAPAFQHGAHTGMVHLYSPLHTKKVVGASLEFLENADGSPVIRDGHRVGRMKHEAVYIDDYALEKIGHPGESFTFQTSKKHGLNAYDTPRWQTHRDIQTAEKILIKHQLGAGLDPAGFKGNWFRWMFE
jgi:RHS repeat-associated protein